MKVMGLIALVIGALLFFSVKLFFIRTERMMIKNGTYEEGSSSEEEFLGLVNKGMLLLRITGVILVFVGGILILIDYLA